MKIGRNDPCHCGSGKKYKKCCIEKETKSDIEDFYPSVNQIEDMGWEPESPDFEDDGFYIDENEDEVEEEEEEEEYEERYNVFLTSELPELSEEDSKLVIEWGEKYKKMNNTVLEREHLVSFIEKYPYLIEYLGLEHEALFEIGHNHFELGIYDQFVELLLRILKEFPIVYRNSYGFYDFDMICWHVAQGRFDEIEQFFERFVNDKNDNYLSKLNETIWFLLAINRSDLISKKIGKNKYIELTVDNILEQALDKPITQELVKELKLKLKGIKTHFKKNNNYLYEQLKRYARPFTKWDENLPKRRSLARDYYLDITDNFAIFLHKNVKLSFASAAFYAQTINFYYRRILRTEKYPDNIFCLDKKFLDKHSLSVYITFWDNIIQCFVQYNAFYYFAAYLETCGNITEEEKRKFQEQITIEYKKFYNNTSKEGPEVLSFEKFPLWEMKENI